MKRKKIIWLLILLLIVWIVIDLNYPYKTNTRVFDPAEVARLDGAMWRSYYEKKRLNLFLQSAELLRKQFGVPFWRSNVMAYHAAKAAFVFKDGKDRTDYNKALPYLNNYYQHINRISQVHFDVSKAANLELEWWIIRRYRKEHPPKEWSDILTQTAATIYREPSEKFRVYADERVEAMLLRDAKGDSIAEADWQQINGMLAKAWISFSNNLR